MTIGDGIALGCCMIGISHLTAWLMRLRPEKLMAEINDRQRQQAQRARGN